MAQLIHDVAPGAGIAFHSAFNSEFDFAEGIIELADAGAGRDRRRRALSEEPFFMDGMVAQAVDIVAAAACRITRRRATRRATRTRMHSTRVNCFVKLNGKPVTRRFHSFGATPSCSTILQPVFPQPDAESGVHALQLPMGSTAPDGDNVRTAEGRAEPSLAVGAESDLDIVFFDYKGHLIRNCPPGVHRGITCQITGDDNEIVGDAVDVAGLLLPGPPKTAQLFFIAFVLNDGPDPGVVKYSWFDNQGVFGVLQFATNSGTSFGHSNAAGNQAIGAASWYVTVPFSTSGLVPPNDTQTPAIDLSPCAPRA